MKETSLITNYICESIPDNLFKISNHIKRYHKGIEELQVNNSDIIIDASCGYGCGTFLLANKAHTAVGLDINIGYLNKAKELFQQDNLIFASYKDYDRLPFMKADKIFCLETFEHIEKSDIDHFFMLLLKHLHVRGQLFLTTQLGNDSPNKYNKYHVNEPSLNTLFDLFAPFFSNINFKINRYKNDFGYFSNECQLTLKDKKH